MTTRRVEAPAKVNLTLHVTGQRADGYHLLDSLVVFAGVADQISAVAAPDLSLRVGGPFGFGVPTDDSNLILRAAHALRQLRGVSQGAAITLEKQLPHAAGIGSGSADAAAALKMLADLWAVPPLPADAPQVLALGADVPVCLNTPRPTRMSGIGEVLAPVPALPPCALVLVRPPVDVPTGRVFATMQNKVGAAMAPLPHGLDYDGFSQWLAGQRNDMEQAAMQIAPPIKAVLAKLKSMPQVGVARMSGSGATCFGLVKDMAAARQVARIIQVSEMNWWVAPAELLRSSSQA